MSESGLWAVLLGWTVLGTIAGLLLASGVGLLSMNPPQYTLAQIMFTLGSLILAARAGWWLAFEQPVNVRNIHIVIVSVVVFGIIGTFCVGSVRWIDGLRKAAVPVRKPSSAQPVAEEKPPTLLDLFNKDFPNVMKVTDDATGIEWKDGSVLPIKKQVYIDLLAKAEFVGFYVPASILPAKNTRSFEACVRLADAVKPAIDDLPKRIGIKGGDAGGVTSLEELVFSGRVFIYHEEPLSNKQKAAIVNAYDSKHYDVQFRGPDYLGSQVITWHHQHDAKAEP